MALTFFDCNAAIGRKSIRTPREFHTAGQLVVEMDYLGISDALVYHFLAKEYAPSIGNARLMEEIAGLDRLHPCWVVMPSYTGETDEPASLIPAMIAKGVKAVRMFPSPPVALPEFTQQLHRYALIETVCSELLGVLEAYRVPLFLEVMNFSSLLLVSWESVEWILASYPGLPLVISGMRHRDNRTLYAFLDRFDHVYFDISLYAVHRGIEDVAGKFGAGRMLFGSGLPMYAGSGSVAQLIYAEIEESQKQMIAGDNLRNLLKGVTIRSGK